MKLTRDAMYLALSAHQGQKYGDKPYHYHLSQVDDLVQKIHGDDPLINHLRAIAWCHDILEDTKTSYKELHDNTNGTVAYAVDLLTKKEGQSYLSYLDLVCSNELARIVKMCDTMANLMNSISEGNAKRIFKYNNQLRLLKEGF